MLYRLLKFPASIAVYFYCRHIKINRRDLLQKKGPLLIASNHPNSFLDAIILASIFKQPIYSLARGDAFVNKFVSGLLKSMNMLPVYRLSEGPENLSNNYDTFSECIKIFEKKGIVLIFSEGRCINEWHLRSLKKGTARLALTAWNKGIDLEVLPLGINYDSFRSFGKRVHLNFGREISKGDIEFTGPEGKSINEFNGKLQEQLRELVYEIGKQDVERRKAHFAIRSSFAKRVLLIVPSMIGYLLLKPFYLIIKMIINNKAVDHFDSVVVGLFFLFFPLLLFIITLVCVLAFKSIWLWSLLLIVPFCGWSYLQLKGQ